MLAFILNKTARVKTCSLIKKEIPTQVFSCEYCIVKFLRTAFLWNNFCYYTFPKFYVMIELFGCLWVQNYVFHISCTIALFSFITLVLESKVRSYFVLVSIPKFLVSVTFARLAKAAQAQF